MAFVPYESEAQTTRLGRLCFARQKRWARRPYSRSTQIIPPSSGAASDPTRPAGRNSTLRHPAFSFSLRLTSPNLRSSIQLLTWAN